MTGQLELYEERDGTFGFRLRDASGTIVATGTGYQTRAERTEALRRWRK